MKKLLLVAFVAILTPVWAHNFPLDPPNPLPLNVVEAFPNLTFNLPVFLTSAPDGSHRLFVLEQVGRIRVFANQSNIGTVKTFLDVSALISRGGPEEGLLGLAFDPDYQTNGFFYIYYTATPPKRIVVARYHVSQDASAADPNSAEILLEEEKPGHFTNHNGGMLAFGPDKMLYIGVGDGGSAGDPYAHGQDKNVVFGKILRINPRTTPYQIPTDNPFYGQSNVRQEIWAYGLRNPWRFSFDKDNGALWVGDVGQDKYEEVDIVTKGGDYGWNVCEGFHRYNASGNCPSQYLPPVIEYSHSVGQSVIGGYLYRGTKVASLRGNYIYGDNVSHLIWAAVYDGTHLVSNTKVATLGMDLASFGEDDQGEVYALGLGTSGKIFRFTDKSGQTPPPFPSKLSQTGLFQDLNSLTPLSDVIPYDVNVALWSDGAEKSRWMALPNNSHIQFDAENAWKFPKGTALVKHFSLRAGNEVRRLETRVLLLQNDGWHGYTYKWNQDGSDADLLADGLTEQVNVGGESHTWTYPSRTDCLRCHTGVSGYALGMTTKQLGQDQLNFLKSKNVFSNDIGNPGQYEFYPHLSDTSVPLEKRARAYLAVNCAHCHQSGGPTPTNLDMKYRTPTSQMNLIGVAPMNGTLGIIDALLVRPGSKERSVLWERMQRRDEFAMPPLASSVVDVPAVNLVGQWIDQLGTLERLP